MNGNVAEILAAIERGEQAAVEQLYALVYQELRAVAERKMAQEPSGITLQPTALVHEAYLRLVDGAPDEGRQNRKHFFAAAAETMRRILVENARKRRRQKRGGHLNRAELKEADLVTTPQSGELLALDEALADFRREEPVKADLVFTFPGVHPQARFSIDFQRTLRIPDDGENYPLPPGLGRFPLRHVDDFAENVPAGWIRHAEAKALKGSEVLDSLKSIAAMASKKGDVPLPENESVKPDNIVQLRNGLKKGQVREGGVLIRGSCRTNDQNRTPRIPSGLRLNEQPEHRLAATRRGARILISLQCAGGGAFWKARPRKRKSMMFPSCGCSQLSWIVLTSPMFSRSTFVASSRSRENCSSSVIAEQTSV